MENKKSTPKLRVCVIGSCNYQQFPNVGYGGIESCIEHLCTGLKNYYSDEIDFCVIVPKILEQRELTKTYGIKIIETEYIPMDISNVWPTDFAHKAMQIIKASNLKPDIIWSVGHWSAQVLSELNIPVVTTMHDAGPWVDNKFIYNHNIHYRFISKFIFDYTFVNANTVPFIDSIKSRSTWFHTGFDDREYIFEENKQDYILWVAGLGWGYEAKGLDTFIELAKRLPNEKFVAYGSGDDNLASKLFELSETIENFEFRGPLYRGEPHINAFKNAKLFVMPTKSTEAFARTTIESITKGTPVIGSTMGSVPEQINSPVIGFCSDNIEELESAIKNLKFDYKKCFEYAKKHYHITKEINSLLDLSSKILNEK